jgi:hypothetical protein
MAWTRRALLFAGGASALVAAIGGTVALQPTAHVLPARPLQALDPTAFSILSAVADTLCPPAGPGLSCAELFVAEDVDAFLATADPAVADEVSMALRLVENALPSLLLDGTVRSTFTAADRATRTAVLEAFRDSRIPARRTVYKALLGLVSATYYGHPALAAHTGYTPHDWSVRP